jgi:GNAT superfamily N-acetyltransferase
MSLILRPGTPADAQICGEICYEAFRLINEQHNFPPDMPNVEMAVGLMAMVFSNPNAYSVVAEEDGRIVGSNCLWEDTAIAGIGPITVAPDAQNKAVGRKLMEDVLAYAQAKNFAGVRLVQATFHNRSLSLYTKLGFDVQEPLTNLYGPALNLQIPGYQVRSAIVEDLEVCNALCRRIHGHDRATELGSAIAQGSATVVEHDGRITGYATAVGFFGHAVGEGNEELKALIGAAPALMEPGILLPTRNAELFRWCLNHGLRVVQPMNLMSLGLYQQPRGAFLASVLF